MFAGHVLHCDGRGFKLDLSFSLSPLSSHQCEITHMSLADPACDYTICLCCMQIWDTFMDYIEPYSSRAPYMIGIGMCCVLHATLSVVITEMADHHSPKSISQLLLLATYLHLPSESSRPCDSHHSL